MRFKRLQFRLRTLIVLIALVALILGVEAWRRRLIIHLQADKSPAILYVKQSGAYTGKRIHLYHNQGVRDLKLVPYRGDPRPDLRSITWLGTGKQSHSVGLHVFYSREVWFETELGDAPRIPLVDSEFSWPWNCTDALVLLESGVVVGIDRKKGYRRSIWRGECVLTPQHEATRFQLTLYQAVDNKFSCAAEGMFEDQPLPRGYARGHMYGESVKHVVNIEFFEPEDVVALKLMFDDLRGTATGTLSVGTEGTEKTAPISLTRKSLNVVTTKELAQLPP